MLFEKDCPLPLGDERIFDSHAHYDDEVYDIDRDELFSELVKFGVSDIVNCGADLESSRKAVDLASQYPFVHAAVGVHPQNADSFDGYAIECLAKSEQIVAIGEIGLDYHWEDVNRSTQQSAFCAQLELAARLNLPVLIHDRDAHADTLDILRRYRPAGVVHCFSGSAEMVEEVVAMGMYIGIGGVLTFKNGRKLVEVAERIPLERILLETDAPYLAPEPYRGSRCHSAYIALVAQRLAEIKGIGRADVISATTVNAKQLFNL